MDRQQKTDIYWMRKALFLASKAAEKMEVPVGALIVDHRSNQLVSRGYNLRETLQSPLGHAELLAIHRASRQLNTWRLHGHTLYVTLEPCVMCCGAISQSRLDRVVFGTLDLKGGASKMTLPQHNTPVPFHGGVLSDECQNILKAFFKNLRNKKQKENQ